MVEGKMTGFAAPKVWRLSKIERDRRGLQWPAPVLATRKTAHWLALTDCYLALCAIERPLKWVPEYREEIEGGVVFAPDAWAVWRRKPFFLEVQLTPLVTKKWDHKWAVYERYYAKLAARRIQPTAPSRPVKPSIVVFSSQPFTALPRGIELIRWEELITLESPLFA